MRAYELRREWPKVADSLQVGDILLFHARRGWMSQKIQELSGSYWNHTALVFIPKDDLPFSGPLIVEAFNDGIEIHQLKKYTDRFDRYDIGIKRFPKLTKVQKNKLVQNFVLNNIDTPYDYARLLGLYLSSTVTKGFNEAFFRTNFSKKFVNSDNFVCSTFVYKTFQELYPEKVSDDEYEKFRQEELYSPGELAMDENFKWIFNKRFK